MVESKCKCPKGKSFIGCSTKARSFLVQFSLCEAQKLELEAIPRPGPKGIFPNVDFYSGIILEAMGFPTSMFTPIFAVSRTVGWISQWKEMIADPQVKIGRPRQLYLGETLREYVDIENR